MDETRMTRKSSKSRAIRSTRRDFLKGLGCSALSATPLLGSLAHLAGAGGAAAQSLPPGNDYRAVVCILLADGNDSYNMIVP